MTPRCCPDCGLEERRTRDDRGRDVVNLDPTTSRCVDCTAAAARQTRVFHSRREATSGQVLDPKALAARNDE